MRKTNHSPLNPLYGQALLTCVMIGCAHQPTPQIRAPDRAELPLVRPFPSPSSACFVVGENDATREFLDHTKILLACPKEDQRAVRQLLSIGARVIGTLEGWTLLHSPHPGQRSPT